MYFFYACELLNDLAFIAGDSLSAAVSHIPSMVCAVVSSTANAITVICDPVARTSLMMDCFSEHVEHSALRTDFRSRPLPFSPVSDTNPHGAEAAGRSVADKFIHEFAVSHGLPVYSVSKSPKDIWNGVLGTRSFYFEKDLRMPASHDPMPPEACIKMIDVDYYVDPKILQGLILDSRVTLLYTIIPEHLAYLSPNGTFTVSATGVIEEHHAGSSPYRHQIWDWRRDFITVVKRGNWWPFERCAHCYVDYRKVAENRFIVMISPATRGGQMLSWFWRVLGDFHPLQRWEPEHHDGVNVLATHAGVIVSRDASRVEYSLTSTQFAEAMSMPKLNSAGLQRITGSTETHYDLVDLFTRLQQHEFPLVPRVFDSREPRSYKMEYTDVKGEDVRAKGQHMFPPIIDGAFTPVSCLSNDLCCLENRLTKLQRNVRSVHPKYYSYITEFIKCVVPTPGQYHPIDISEVIEESSATQRKKYEGALMEPEGLNNKAFQKTEFYDEIKDPRNISAVDPKHVVNMSRYTKVLCGVLKTTTWYAFGLSPRELGEAVHALLEDPRHILVEGDFSKYDGTQSTFCVDLNAALMLRLFHPAYADEIRKLRYELSYAIFKTEHRVRYGTGDSQKSGSATTSCDNTVTHAFAQFCHYRNCSYSVEEAYRAIGLCAGDDGLMRTPNPSGYEKTCSDLNFSLKCALRNNDTPVGFLGRIWIDWGSPNSFFDPMRALSKFHCSDSSDRKIDRNILAWRKAAGYFVTDSGNFVGHVAGQILRITRAGKTETIERREWLKDVLPENTRMTSESLFEKFWDRSVFHVRRSHPITCVYECGEWDESLVALSTRLEMPPQVVYEWYQKLAACNSIDEIPLLYRVPTPEKTSTTVTVDGQVIGPAMGPAPRPDPVQMPVCFEQFTRKNCSRKEQCKFLHVFTDICFDFCKGKCTRRKCKRKHVPMSARV